MSTKSLAVYTATGCSACDTTILDIHYQVSSLTRWADIAFWPFLQGCQWDDLEKQEHVDVCFFAGAIRTEEDRHAALTLRDKSTILVACGACAAFGGLPGLVNLSGENAGPGRDSGTVEGIPPLPQIEKRLSALSQVVNVNYTVPGCPPPRNFLWAALQSLVCDGRSQAGISFAASNLPDSISASLTSGILPPHGSTFAGERAVCAGCSRKKEEKKFQQYRRPFQTDADPGRCLLEQGLICQGLATREGCGGLCTAVGAGCRGCFGKAQAVFDPGAKMVSAISSTFDSTDAAEIEALSAEFVDLAGTFYRYTLPTHCALKSGPAEE